MKLEQLPHTGFPYIHLLSSLYALEICVLMLLFHNPYYVQIVLLRYYVLRCDLRDPHESDLCRDAIDEFREITFGVLDIILRWQESCVLQGPPSQEECREYGFFSHGIGLEVPHPIVRLRRQPHEPGGHHGQGRDQ